MASMRRWASSRRSSCMSEYLLSSATMRWKASERVCSSSPVRMSGVWGKEPEPSWAAASESWRRGREMRSDSQMATSRERPAQSATASRSGRRISWAIQKASASRCTVMTPAR